MITNVSCIKFRSKRSSNTVLCLLQNLMHQTLKPIQNMKHLKFSICNKNGAFFQLPAVKKTIFSASKKISGP